MIFSIAFIAGPEFDPESGIEVLQGRLQLGEFQEDFFAPATHWSKDDYENQWRQGLTRLVERRLPSCLITAIGEPAETGVIWWLLYPDGEMVHVQNQYLIPDVLTVPFEVDDPYRFISPRETVSTEGGPISEWHLPMSSLREFAKGR
jgi:hypothetical protein